MERELEYLKNYLKLEMAIRMERSYIRPMTDKDRGIGKTHSLVELAIEYELPIIVGSEINRRYIIEISKREFNKDISNRVIKLDVGDSLRDIYIKTCLIDEGLNDIVIGKLLDMGITVIGYMLTKN